MNLAVITCAAYSDAWPAFFGLLSKFWPDHPPVTLLTDYIPDSADVPDNVDDFVPDLPFKPSWCEVLSAYVGQTEEPFLLMQEDFLLTAPVRAAAMADAEKVLWYLQPGCFRLYPCPGPSKGWLRLGKGDYGVIQAGEQYRISCQAGIWYPSYLRNLFTEMPNAKTAADFELMGTKASCFIPRAVMSVYRESKPWPIEYICSAITRGKWNPDAKRLCDQHGIEVDWTRREFAA